MSAEAGKGIHKAKETIGGHTALAQSIFESQARLWAGASQQSLTSQGYAAGVCKAAKLSRVQKYTWNLCDGILQGNRSCLSGAGISEDRGKCFQE